MAYSVKAGEATGKLTHTIRVWKATTLAPTLDKRTHGAANGSQGLSNSDPRGWKHKSLRINGTKVK